MNHSLAQPPTRGSRRSDAPESIAQKGRRNKAAERPSQRTGHTVRLKVARRIFSGYLGHDLTAGDTVQLLLDHDIPLEVKQGRISPDFAAVNTDFPELDLNLGVACIDFADLDWLTTRIETDPAFAAAILEDLQ